MKKILSSVLCIALCASTAISLTGCGDRPVADDYKDNPNLSVSQNFVQHIKCGWNLGNTLEAVDIRNVQTQPSSYSVESIETGWQNPKTTKAMFQKVADSGFNAVRIPVSWYRFVKKNGDNYEIDSAWLKRVKEVVDYAHSLNMYVIINVHHDDKDWLNVAKTGDEWEQIKKEYGDIWKAIAEYFKNYDEKLIFEGVNEVVSGTPDAEDSSKINYDWYGNDDSMQKLNELYDVFVPTVRKSGGKNDKRFLILSTYGAQKDEHQLNALKLPENDERIIVEVHWYTESTDVNEISYTAENIANYSDNVKLGVIVGECGIQNKADDDTKVAWAKAFVGSMSKLGLRCFIWDDGGNYSVLDRNNLKWYSDSMIKTLVDSAVQMQTQTENSDE